MNKFICGHLRRLTALVITLTLPFSMVLPPQTAHAQSLPAGQVGVLNLPRPGVMVPLSPAFNPAMIKGVTVHPDNPFLFDFIVHPGDSKLQGEALKQESTKLIKYFMAALTVPEEEMWVNLSPYEKDRIIPAGFGNTEMGRDLLAQDYMLKQLTASLMYPENELGSEFWDRVYRKAQEKYGTTEVPMNTFNKVWIIPERATIYENGASVFVVESHLKVMLEEDYLAMRDTGDVPARGGSALGGKRETRNLTYDSRDTYHVSQIIKEIIIPELEKEVNEGKTFANLRQISNSVILATWYKKKVQGSILENIYIDKNKVQGVDTQDKDINQKIYKQYIEAFKKGVYNFIKEDYDPATQEMIPRKYFSGGHKAKWSGTFKAATNSRATQDGLTNSSIVQVKIVDLSSETKEVQASDLSSEQKKVDMLQMAKNKGFQLEKAEIEQLMNEIFRGAPNNIKKPLTELFKENSSYFDDPDHLRSFLERHRRFKGRIYRQLSPKLFKTPNSLLKKTIFLMIARGTIKDLVWQFGQDGREAIQELGGDPKKLYNLFSSDTVRSILLESIEENLINKQKLSDELEWETGYALKEFIHRPELFDIFSDQIAIILRDLFNAKQKQLSEGSKKAIKIEGLLGRLSVNTHGDLLFELTNRNLHYLKGGDRAGDCSACGSFNYWTAGSWNATFENYEVETRHKNDFFSRFVLIVGKSNEKLTLWVHGAEFTPLTREGKSTSARGSRFADQKLQEALLLESLKFIAAYANRAGISQVYVTGISNSHGFVDILRPLLDKLSSEVDIKLEDRNFELLNGINSAHNIHAMLSKDASLTERTESIYLQGWKTATNFRKTTEDAKEEKEIEDDGMATLGGTTIDRNDLDRGSRTLMGLIQKETSKMRKSLKSFAKDHDFSDLEGFQGFLGTLAELRDIPEANAEKRISEVVNQMKETIILLTEIFDPGFLQEMEKEIGKIEKSIIQKIVKLYPLYRETNKTVRGIFNDARPEFLKALEELENTDTVYEAGIIDEEEAFEDDVQDSREEGPLGDYDDLDEHERDMMEAFDDRIDDSYKDSSEASLEEEELDEDDIDFQRREKERSRVAVASDIWTTRVENGLKQAMGITEANEKRMGEAIYKIERFVYQARPPFEEFQSDNPSHYIILWENNLAKKVSATNIILKRTRRGRSMVQRPKKIKDFYDHIDNLINHIDRLEIDSHSVIATSQRINHELLEEFEQRLRGSEVAYDEQSIRLMVDNPSEVIDYYKSIAKEFKRVGSLTSKVNAFSLEGLSYDIDLSGESKDVIIQSGLNSLGRRFVSDEYSELLGKIEDLRKRARTLNLDEAHVEERLRIVMSALTNEPRLNKAPFNEVVKFIDNFLIGTRLIRRLQASEGNKELEDVILSAQWEVFQTQDFGTQTFVFKSLEFSDLVLKVVPRQDHPKLQRRRSQTVEQILEDVRNGYEFAKHGFLRGRAPEPYMINLTPEQRENLPETIKEAIDSKTDFLILQRRHRNVQSLNYEAYFYLFKELLKAGYIFQDTYEPKQLGFQLRNPNRYVLFDNGSLRPINDGGLTKDRVRRILNYFPVEDRWDSFESGFGIDPVILAHDAAVQKFLDELEREGFFASKDGRRPGDVWDGTDLASESSSKKVGGIDLNPQMMDIQSTGQDMGIQFNFDDAELQNLNIEGFIPVIINITPITNIPLLLGESETETKEPQLSSL